MTVSISSCGIAWHKSIVVKSSPIVIGLIGTVGSDEPPAAAQAGINSKSPATTTNKNIFAFIASLLVGMNN
jgi:hypothetical protein